MSTSSTAIVFTHLLRELLFVAVAIRARVLNSPTLQSLTLCAPVQLMIELDWVASNHPGGTAGHWLARTIRSLVPWPYETARQGVRPAMYSPNFQTWGN